MRIIYLGLAVPNLNDYHNMYTELMAEFRDNGHEVVIVGPVEKGTEPGLGIEDGIQVLRVPTLQLFNVGMIQKGIANLRLPYQYIKALKKSGIDLKFDLVVLPTPPITLSKTASWLKRKYNATVYLILRDIFPQNAVDLKIMGGKGPSFRYFRKMEKKLYTTADKIGCMSPGNIEYVLKHNPEINSENIHLLPNWGKLQESISEMEIDAIRKKYGLENKFIVIFGGNIGRPQKMENILALAKACTDIPDIHFLVIGGGNCKEDLVRGIKEMELTNMTHIDFLSRRDFFKTLHIANVALVSLSEDFTIPNIPSKTVVYFNAQKPVLASIDAHTDYGKILDRLNAGLSAQAGNTVELKDRLLAMYQNPELCVTMGKNGFDHMKGNWLTEHAYANILQHLN